MFALTTGITPTISGGTHNVMTKRDAKCFNFDGVDEYVNTTLTDIDLKVNDAITIAAWIKLDDGRADANQIICGAESSSHSIKLFIYSTGQVGMTMKYGSTLNIGKTTVQLDDGVMTDWAFVAGKYDGSLNNDDDSHIATFTSLNGSNWENLLGQPAWSSPDFPNLSVTGPTYPIWIGGDNDDGSFVTGTAGRISNLIIFNKALSQAELSELYDGGMAFKNVSPNQIGGIIAWYRMGDESSDSLNHYFANDDCSDSDRLSEWTVETDIALTHNGDHYEINYTDNGSNPYLYTDNSAISVNDIIKISADLKGALGGEKITMHSSSSGQTKTLTTSYETYTHTSTVSSIESITYLPKLRFLSANGSQPNISMQNFKIELVDAGGDPIGAASLTDASSNSHTGTPTNMEIIDIVEDSP